MNAPSQSLPVARRRRVPTILQMEATECGAACLAMVLAYHGAWVTLPELRAACGVSRDGSRASNMLRAARSYGMEAAGWRVEPGQLGAYPMPAIAFWDFNHFVVVEGAARGRVHINDPAAGPLSISAEEFDERFTGVLLTAVPGAGFQRRGAPPRTWRSLLGRLTGSKGAIGVLALAGLTAMVPALAVATAAKIFVDQILLDNLQDWLRPLLLGLALAMLAQGALSWLQSYVLARLHWKLSLRIGLDVFGHLLRLPAEFFAQRHTADIAMRVGTAEHLCRAMAELIPATLVNGVAALVYGALMLLFDPVLAGIGIVLALLGLLLVRASVPLRTDAARRLRREAAAVSSTALSGLQSIETLKASGLEDGFFGRWYGAQTKLLNAHQRIDLALARVGLLPALLSGIAAPAILTVAGLRIMDGAMTIGDLVAFQTLLAGFLGPIHQLLSVSTRLQEMTSDLERLDDVLRYPADPHLLAPSEDGGDATSPTRSDPGRLRGGVCLSQVQFGYSRLEAPLIDGFELDLQPGQRVALVGPSGCGKSTIARLVAGLYRPWAGTVAFDGLTAEAIAHDRLAAALALVDQRIVLFQGSVRENLTLWDPTIAEADVVAAAQDACIHEVIMARPGGYDAPVAEGGANFSGGQAQRLEIARALTRCPAVLILDEATSALDATTEARVLANLRRRGCTTILVAHRLSTIRDVDEILVLDRGRVVERGPHHRLSDVPGLYRDLIRAA
ncbi:NHLP family bacteriocin export ABC transporter peptidase/permease/ATPase subunit [Methylobacterium phyllosphaerae]|uniref:NHLM bacteriocin system ABC transporter, peptidase/ATP-binding protein n=2 Tax=Methylobacterium phyllosphaerae TaxID=418223 RepID=A0AAE8HXG1_9HYPH|nr:NHLP family bacteriocin export ABC transporter peptidase/permease/ATPase subunit [Methylobacterium phyllosphaerae]KTS06076.1 ABC transporter [Methylobacterium radiotolerans]KTS44547.1 ABC transporter [Methylobacterium radiotolerans]SFH62500.1 NHLM bacteriocin system ABC transporter, peptidase/ATP-binding protein [Methylobacterium phyllosphaerae]